MVLAHVLEEAEPPKMVAVRSTAASPLNPSPLYAAWDTAALSSVGAPRVRFGAVPDHVRRYRSRPLPCWSHRIMKSPRSGPAPSVSPSRLAHGLQLAASVASLAA